MILLLSLLILILALGLLERQRHAARREAIAVRIHVNGSRGKSSVVRLIAAGLRAGGLRTLAKTTGTEARLILEDSSEVPFRRTRFVGPPSIAEQKKLLAIAASRKAEVLVTECMAIQPDIQRVAEDFFIRSHIGVITNVRLDHTDVMGQDYAAIAACLALTTPEKGRLVLGQNAAARPEVHAVFVKTAAARNTVLQVAKPQKKAGKCLEACFAENTAVALTVCAMLGVPASRALAGMRSALPDPGVLKRIRCEFEGRRFFLVDAFSANDPESTLALWKLCLPLPEAKAAPVIGVFPGRADRGFRLPLFAAHFLPLVAASSPAYGAASVAASSTGPGMSAIALLGEGLLSAKKAYKRAGGKVFMPFWSGRGAVPALLRKTAALFPEAAALVLFGFGNSKGMGNRISNWFLEHGTVLDGPEPSCGEKPAAEGRLC